MKYVTVYSLLGKYYQLLSDTMHKQTSIGHLDWNYKQFSNFSNGYPFDVIN